MKMYVDSVVRRLVRFRAPNTAPPLNSTVYLFPLPSVSSIPRAWMVSNSVHRRNDILQFLSSKNIFHSFVSYCTVRSYSSSTALSSPSSSASSASSVPTVIINKFTDFTPWIKRFILRVHPDMIATHPVQYIERNEQSLSVLFTVLENLELRCGNSKTPTTGNHLSKGGSTNTNSKLNPHYRLHFYYESKASVRTTTSTGALHECTVSLSVPSTIESLYHQYCSKEEYNNTGKETNELSLPIEVQYHQLEWLMLTLATVQKLMHGIELKVNFTLSETLRQRYQEMQKYYSQQRSSSSSTNITDPFRKVLNQHKDDPFENINPQDATQQLLTNIAKYSPIVQGKGPYAFVPKGLDSSSAFTLKQRTFNIDRILSRSNYVQVLTNQGISNVEAAHAMNRLRTLFITYHDSIGGYHSIWSKIRLTIGLPTITNDKTNRLRKSASSVPSSTMTYYADVHTLSFYLPLNFDDQLTVNLIEKYLHRMINYGRHNLPRHQLNKTV